MNRFFNKAAVILLLILLSFHSGCERNRSPIEDGYSAGESEEFSLKNVVYHIRGFVEECMKKAAVRIIDKAFTILGEDPDPSLIVAWPLEISRKDEAFTNESELLYVHVYSPLQVKIDCETQSGRLDIKIMDYDGNIYFAEEKMATGTYWTDILEKGSYIIVIKADMHTGYFKISTLSN